MKVHLIFAPTNFSLNFGDLGKGIDPPLGIMYLASYARKHFPDFEYKITDGSLRGYDETLKEIKDFNADVIGISVITTNVMGGYKLSGAIREFLPDSKIVYGGPHATAFPEEPFYRGNADVVISGEGEITFKELLAYFNTQTSSLSDIKGIFYKEQGENIVSTGFREFIKYLDDIPFPARDLVDMSKYKGWQLYKAQPSTYIISSRGCPFRCTFCSNNIWRNEKRSPVFRLRSPENIVDELEYLHKEYGYNEFFDQTDEFNVRIEHSKEILREIIRRDLKIYYKCQLRAKPVDEEFVSLMKQAGVWYVHLGIETANEETMTGIKKKVTHKDIENCCRLLNKYGIKIWGLFMYFNIWEENGELKFEGLPESEKTFEYAKKLYKDGLIDFFGGSICTPFPGSELWDIAIKHYLIKEEYKWNWSLWFSKRDLKLIHSLPGIKEETIFKFHQKTFYFTAKSLLFSKMLNIKNIKIALIRFLYYLFRQLRILIQIKDYK